MPEELANRIETLRGAGYLLDKESEETDVEKRQTKRMLKEKREGGMGRVSRFFLDYVDEVPTMEGKVAVLFEGFFKNKMQHVMGVLTNPQIQRDPEIVKRMIQNVEDFYHHFSPRDRHHEGLYEELIGILRCCPDISEEAQSRGLSILKEIFSIYGYALDLDKTKLRRVVRDVKQRQEEDKKACPE